MLEITAILIYNFYPIIAVMIILLAWLIDLPILTVAKNHFHVSLE
ncbi:MAG: hypothetical protein ACU83N_11985 [Gammaproteobacteria bacterium]